MSLITELKRRNVFRVGAAYMALAWVVVQITGAIVPALNLPDLLVPVVVWIGVIGFPCVVIFSWVYELTPEGLKRESEVERDSSITHQTGRRLDLITIVLVVFAIGFVAFDRLMPHVAPPATGASAAPDNADSASATSQASPGTNAVAPQPAAAAVDDRSIAVLPFVDMSQAKDQEYFSDGIAEELLNQLARIRELKVTARTSSFAFKGEKIEIPEIAKRLKVANVLEGSVRKAGDKVRITAQLVRAADGYHLWSQTYDRTLEDIFAVQDEIAAAVVGELKITLLSSALQAKPVNPEAYALWLQARAMGRKSTASGYEQAVELYKQALKLDPDYSSAWSGLAMTYLNQVGSGLASAELLKPAREAAAKGVALDPTNARAHGAVGTLAMNFDGDLVAGAKSYERALALDPHNIDLLGNAGLLAGNLGRLDLELALEEYAVAQDPLSPVRSSNLANTYMLAGRPDEAIAAARNAVGLDPEIMLAWTTIAAAQLQKGEPEAALESIQKESNEVFRLVTLPAVYHALGRPDDAEVALRESINKYAKEASYNIAAVCAYIGQTDRAFEWLDKAVTYNDPGLSAIATDIYFAKLRDDPRWLPFLRKIGKAPEQLAAIEFDVKLPQ